MTILKNKINERLKNKKLTIYQLNKLINYDESSLNKAIKFKIPFPSHIIEKLLPILEVSKEEFTSWIVAEKYSNESIQVAIEELKNKLDDNTPVLAKNIDKIISSKGLSRTELSKLIKYDQSAFNKMIVGKISMSKTVISKLAQSLEINENTIQGWILTDKYILEVLELALKAERES